MATFADISIRFGADLKQFSSQMQNAQRSLNSYGQRLQKVGAGLTIGLTTPLLAFAALSVKNFDTQAKAIAQVEAGLKSTGNAVGFTSEALQKMASDLQNNTLFGDEAILKDATAQLLTFTNIAGEQFKRTQLAALDLATRLDGDLKGASIQLGKALNDPIKGLAALGKSGIQFSKDQTEVIKTLAETGRLAEAQTLILDELEKQYGGSAAAAAKAGLGPFTQLKNILGDITEDFGKIILEGISPFVEKIKNIALSFQSLSPETKKFIVIAGGIAAAIGPLLALAGTILPAIGTGLTLLTGPIGLVVAGLTAIGVVIIKNWKPIKQVLVDIANYFIDLYNESFAFRLVAEGIITSFNNIFDTGKFVFSALGSIISAMVSQLKTAFSNLGQIVKAVLTGNIEAIPGLVAKNFKESTKGFGILVDNLSKDFNVLKSNIEKNITDSIVNVFSEKKYKFLADVDTTEVEKKVENSVKKGLNAGASGGSGQSTLQTQKIQTLPTQGLAQLEGSTFSASLAGFTTEALDEKALAFTERLLQFRDDTAQILADTAANFVVGFGDIIGGIVAGTAGLDDVAGFLLNTMGDLAQQLGKSAIQIGITMKALKLSFKSPFAAIAAGVALVALGGLLKGVSKKFAGNFAGGGLVGGASFSGDKLQAGVNSGELILNVAQQKNLAGALTRGTSIKLLPSLDFDGRKMRVMLATVDNYNNRVTGR